MPRQVLLVFANAAEGREADFNAWYDDHHLREAVDNLPGAVSAQRYRLSPHQPHRESTVRSTWQYLAMYELEADDADSIVTALRDLRAAGTFTSSGGAVAEGHASWLYEQARPKVDESANASATKPSLGPGRHVFLALTSPVEGREDDFKRWYDAHIPEVLEHYPGLTTGELLKAASEQPQAMSPRWSYLALYDLEADDTAEYVSGEPHGLAGMTPNGGSLAPNSAVWIYTELGPRVTNASAEKSAVRAR